jgi:Protein of unknown function (DUF4012)
MAPPGSLSLFSSAGLSPNLPTSGEEIPWAYQATGVRANGMIALDPTVLAGLLHVSGPVTTAGFGKVGGDDVVQLLLADSWAVLMSEMAGHLLEVTQQTDQREARPPSLRKSRSASVGAMVAARW